MAQELRGEAEHKGVSNRVLRELGWVHVSSGRDSPRNSECTLASEGELYRLYQELLALRSEPSSFIGRIFNSNDKVWVDRCSTMLRDG